MNQNKYIIERTVYTSLDWLGDVGGLMGILFSLGSFIMMFISGNGLNYMLLSHMFNLETSASLDRTNGINGRLQ